MEEPEDVEATSQSSSHLEDQEDWQVIEYLLQEAGGEFAKHLRNGSGINKDLLMGLGVVFGTDTLDAALELIDRKAVTQVCRLTKLDRDPFLDYVRTHSQ